MEISSITNGDITMPPLPPRKWTEIAELAIHYLKQEASQRGEPEKHYFHIREDIIRYIDEHWDTLCDGRQRTAAWQNTVTSSVSNSGLFQNGIQVVGEQGWWGLRDRGATIDKSTGKRRDTHAGAKRKRNTNNNYEEEREPKRGWHSDLEGTTTKEVNVQEPTKIHKPTGSKSKLCMDADNSAPQIQFLEKGNTITNAKGYRMARASHGVSSGTWYWEAKIEPIPAQIQGPLSQNHHSSKPPPDPHWRLGWATNEAQVQAPVGYDKYGYGYRDIEGVVVHTAKRTTYGAPYKVGDVIGFMIVLPELPSNHASDAKTSESNSSKKDEEPEIHPGSKIMYFKNGHGQSVAFEDIYKGTYYPSVSLYFNATVTVNFGPDFLFPPKTHVSYLPISSIAEYERMKQNANKMKHISDLSSSATSNSAEGALMGMAMMASMPPIGY